LNMAKGPGVKDMNPSWYVMGKFDTREVADAFKDKCVRDPKRLKTFYELVAAFG